MKLLNASEKGLEKTRFFQKKYLLILGIISVFLIAACSQQVQTPTKDDGASMKVPAPGNEDVEEMVVVEDGSEGEEPVTLPPEEGSLVHDVEQQVVEPQVVEISMTAKRWEFEPGTITVKKGQKVKLNIKSVDVTHGFALPDFGVSQRLEPGKEVTVEFTADKKGTFTFFCNVACGSGHSGMKGTLVVE